MLATLRLIFIFLLMSATFSAQATCPNWPAPQAQREITTLQKQINQ